MAKKTVGIGIGIAIVVIAIASIVGIGSMSEQSDISEPQTIEEPISENPGTSDEGSTFTLTLEDGISTASNP